MRGASQDDGRGAVRFLHAEGREPAKIGVERGIEAFYGAKLLKRQGREMSILPQRIAVPFFAGELVGIRKRYAERARAGTRHSARR